MYESQVAVLREMLEAQDNFVQEATNLSKMIQEGQGDLLAEGLADSFQKLMSQGGFNALKRAVQTALVAGTLMGVSDSAMAQAAQKAGANPQQATELSAMVKAGGKQGGTAGVDSQKFAQELTKLNQRFVVADGTSQKDFMKFSGNIQDVVGIEPKNGYPIFAKGSESESRLKAAFANPQVIHGVVNVRGQEFEGDFVKNDGLYYTYTQSAGGNAQSTPAADPTTAPTPATPATAAATPAAQNTEMIDFTGLFQQAKLRFQQYNRGGVAKDYGKQFSDFASYVPEFLRQNDKGFQGMTDDQISNMFAKGLKATVEKGKFTMGGVSRPNMIRR